MADNIYEFFVFACTCYDIGDFEKGDILNIIHGRHEAVIVTNERYLKKLLGIFKGEKIFNVEKTLSY